MKRVLSVGISIFLFVCIALLCAVALPKGVSAMAQSDLTVVQTGTATYGAKVYIGATRTFIKFGEEYNNELFNSFTFYLDGEVVSVEPSGVRFSSLSTVGTAGEYSDEMTVVYGGKQYVADVDFTIEKKTLTVSALINGQESLTINEGQAYSTSVRYDGFVGHDDESVLDAPAIITKQPKLPVNNYRIVPELAKSENYEFDYRAALLTILSHPDSQKTYYEGDTPVIILTGSFSPYYTLQYKDIGTAATSEDYAIISQDLDKYFGTGQIFEDYKRSDCFSVNLYLDGATVSLAESTGVSVLLDNTLRGKKKYVLVHFPADGSDPNLISGEEKNGYLTFETVGLGTYVILTPVEGVNITLIIAIVAGIVVIGLLAVVFGAVFRRKY